MKKTGQTTRFEMIENFKQPDNISSHTFATVIKHKTPDEMDDELFMYSYYLFQCLHCMSFFDSVRDVRMHFATIGLHEMLYTVKKLIYCLHCCHHRIISTPRHTLTSAISCGYCQNPQNVTVNHIYTDTLLQSLNVDFEKLRLCRFIPGCCTTMQFHTLTNTVLHIFMCDRRFRCNKCPDIRFESMLVFTEHCISIHHELNVETIMRKNQDIGKSLELCSDMLISFPDVAKEAIHSGKRSDRQNPVGHNTAENARKLYFSYDLAKREFMVKCYLWRLKYQFYQNHFYQTMLSIYSYVYSIFVLYYYFNQNTKY